MAESAETQLSELLELNNKILREKDYDVVLSQILGYAQSTSQSDGIFIYILNDDNFFNLEVTRINSLNINKVGSDNISLYATIYLPELKNKPIKSMAESCAYNKEIVNSANVFSSSDYDNKLFKRFETEKNYTVVSCLSLPIINRKGHLIAVIQLINAKDNYGKIISYNQEMQKQLQSIASLIGITLENRQLRASYNQLLESFIEVLARAIDAKSPYTGAHCQRVPVIARMLATAAVQQTSGPLKNFEMSRDDWYALNIASWLHDCGKITTPEYIVDKATKLETIYNRIHEIRDRFEILRRDAHIEYLKKRLANTESQEELQKEFIGKVKQLEDDFSFIARCNTGDTPVTEADIRRLEKLTEIKFMRYFDRTKGLSWSERENIKDMRAYQNPGYEELLQNRPDLISKGYNYGELYNLEIPRGTITKEEREKINEHIVVTIDMLKAIHFPKELSKVVEYAGAHHERIDGKGYPNGLTGEQMSIPAKIMAIADIFEALTASDRPYKEPKKLSEVLRIMKDMKNEGHIDPDLYHVFIESGVYKEYAEQYISPNQIDEIRPEDYF